MASSCQRWFAVIVLVGVVVTTGVSCSSDDSTAGTTSTLLASEATVTALGVCGVLVEFVDLVADEINAASGEIQLDTDPDVARQLLLDATSDIQAAVDALPVQYEAVRVSDDGDLGRVIDDAGANTADLDEQLADITAELTDGLEGEDARAILSAVFIDMEKILSLAQPDQGDYSDAALVAALDTEEPCQHTISR